MVRETESGEGLDPQVKASIDAATEKYRELGATIVDVTLPHAEYGIAAYYVIALCEASKQSRRDMTVFTSGIARREPVS